jgi:hypothetical protein
MVPCIIEAQRTLALELFQERKADAAKLGQIDNASLLAGEPMYFYCAACGCQCDMKQERWFLKEPRTHCGECEGMIEIGWMNPEGEILVTI